MKFYIYKNNQQSGPFAESEVLDRLRGGKLSPDDLAAREGESGWKPLGELLTPQMPTTAGGAFPAVAAVLGLISASVGFFLRR